MLSIESVASSWSLLLVAGMLGSGAFIAWLITASRRVARHGEAVERALQASDERLQRVVNGSSEGHWDWDIRSGSVYRSPRIDVMLDHDFTSAADKLAPRRNTLVALLHPDDLGACVRALRAHLRHALPYDVESRLRARGGEYRWFRIHGQAVRDENGRALRMAGSLRDITGRKRAEANAAKHAMRQGLIAAYGQLALENPEIDELMARAVVAVQQGLEAEFCRLLALGPDDHTLLLKGASGWDAGWSQRPCFSAEAETENRFIIGARESLVIDDFAQDNRFKPSEMLVAHGVRSAGEALICGTHGSYAVLGIYSREPSRFNTESIDFLRGITNTLAAAMDRKVAEERLTFMAQFDPLTGLPNRGLYLDRLWQTITQAGRDRSPVAVLFIDLDRFKIVNDTLGHGAGDGLLLQVAQRLRAAVRGADTVGRLGGDEFAIALTGLTRADDADAVAHKIVQDLCRPFSVAGQTVYVSASVGISIFPQDGSDPDTLLRSADTAMYRAKESGRNTHRFFLAQMNERAVEQLKIEAQLRGALEREEFLLHYQPKVNLDTGQISGFEALLRWQHPERGLVPPADFISILEDTGLIIPVGDWVVAQVCRQLQQWQAAGLSLKPVAVNLSARQFNQKDLDAVIGRILESSGTMPDLLELELTESMLMSDSEAAVQTLINMKARGTRLSVDDFGTGYSSLAYLKRFPLDSLKIDRAFIRDVTTDPDDAIIAKAIINLAHSLNLKVVAEGVETEAQLSFLRAHACDEIQGYYFARPMPAADCTRALREGWCLPGRENTRSAVRALAVVREPHGHAANVAASM